MSENPLQALFHTAERISSSIQTHLSNFLGHPRNPASINNNPFFSLSPSSQVTPFDTDPSYLHPSDVIRKCLMKKKVELLPVSVKNDIYPSSSCYLLCVPAALVIQGKSAVQPLSKEELGRATWTFLHTLAAQYPDNPTRQQKRDVKELMTILSRMYPCKECADHFKEVLRVNPVEAGSHVELSRWLCRVHNVVNRSLAKPVFPCERVDARWGKLECEDRACDVLGVENYVPKRHM